MAKKEDTRTLPAIHETSRLWHPTEAKTVTECVRYLRKLKPGWSLTWLRDAAPQILNSELPEGALRTAVERHVPERARNSVWSAVELLIAFAREGQWSGVALPYHDVPVGLGLTVRVQPVGMFASCIRDVRCLVALQPRQDFAPTHAQDQIWISALFHEFCRDPLEPLEPLILDLSKRTGKHHRSLTELTRMDLPILSKDELDGRLDMVAKCFALAKDMVPPAESKPRPQKPSEQIDLFDAERKDRDGP